MKKWILRMMFFPALLVMSISLHPALTVCRVEGGTCAKAILCSLI